MPHSDVSQLDLAYSIERPDWVAVKLLTEEIQDEISQNRANLLYCLANWLMAVNIFKRFEEQNLILKEPSARDREFHRVVLTGLLAVGEKLLHEFQRHSEIETAQLGVELAEVQSAVNEIRLAYQEWFSDMKPERKKAILLEVFGGPT
jgi:hypothetical protein